LSRLLALTLFSSCGALTADPGLRAWLRVADAQFVAASLPVASTGAAIVEASLSRATVARGDTELTLSGSLARRTTAVQLEGEGAEGFWVIRAGLADPTVPDVLTLRGALTVSPDAPPGATVVHLQAVTDGVVGPRLELPLEVVEPNRPTGALVISLQWDTASDLDLHVVDAHGVEIWARHPNSWAPTPGQPVDPNAWRTGGVLDADSNAQCLIDGRDAENVVWSQPPPAGHYVVRVDTVSLCEASSARWRVEVTSAGQTIATAEGASTVEATRGAHDRGAGVTALEFDLP
jgi:hypothetical protein